MKKVALTSGPWAVIDKEVYVDEALGLVYFHGLKDSPLEKHLYVVSMNQPGHVRRLTIAGYSHSAHMNSVSWKFNLLYKMLCELSPSPFAGLHNVCDVVQQYSIGACQSGVQGGTQGRHCGRRGTRYGRLGRGTKT